MTPTPATEFFQALTDLLLGADAHPQPAPVAAPMVKQRGSCRSCRDGYREDGSPCPYEGMADEPDDGDDISLEQALRNMGLEP